MGDRWPRYGGLPLLSVQQCPAQHFGFWRPYHQRRADGEDLKANSVLSPALCMARRAVRRPPRSCGDSAAMRIRPWQAPLPKQAGVHAWRLQFQQMMRTPISSSAAVQTVKQYIHEVRCRSPIRRYRLDQCLSPAAPAMNTTRYRQADHLQAQRIPLLILPKTAGADLYSYFVNGGLEGTFDGFHWDYMESMVGRRRSRSTATISTTNVCLRRWMPAARPANSQIVAI